ncbi:MAG TPA: helix-turn-helix transcriptional regulator [Chthoniobacteraceae bacterium]|nr:helix-turn-helix transcriptional regulator [Chthoniobacteraceae bacterium]
MEQPKRNAIGVQIRRLRNSKRVSQQQLASRCSLVGYEVTRSTLAKIEAEIRAVSDIELFVIAKALKVALEELYPADFERALSQHKVTPFHRRDNSGGNAGLDS